MTMEPECEPKKRKRRTRFPPEAKATLEAVYEQTKHPDRQQVTELAEQLGYKYETIKMWFDNRRYNEVNRPSGRRMQQLAKEHPQPWSGCQVTCMGVPTMHQQPVFSTVTSPQENRKLSPDAETAGESFGSTQVSAETARGSGTQTACTNSNATRSAPPLTFVRPIIEPFVNVKEENSVLEVEDGTTGEDRKEDELEESFEEFLEMVRGRKMQYKLSDFEDFKREAERLFRSLHFVCLMRFSQGNRSTVSNDYTSGVFSLHCLSPEVAAKEEVMEFRFIHESKLEGTQYMGNQVASERLVLFYSVPNHDVFQKDPSLGAKARGSCESLESVHFMPKQKNADDLPLVYEPDKGTQYWAWGNIEKVKSLLNTTLSGPELLSFLILCVNPTAHTSHWLSVSIQHHFFGRDVPHYYKVNEEID